MREEEREKRGERRDKEGWRGRSIERDSSGKERKKTKEREGGRMEEKKRGEIGRERRQRRVMFERERRRRKRKENGISIWREEVGQSWPA